jgi:hypothetical protein
MTDEDKQITGVTAARRICRLPSRPFANVLDAVFAEHSQNTAHWSSRTARRQRRQLSC